MNWSIGQVRTIDRYDLTVLLGIAIYSIFISIVSIYRYSAFFADIDLAIFNQAYWTTTHYGGILESSLEAPDIRSHLGIHFSPVLLSLIPLYSLIPGPETIISAQTALLALGAIPIYLCGREILGCRIGCLIGLLYLLYPPLHGVNLYDFHEVAFLPLFLGMALWGLVSGKKNLCLLFCLLSLLVKEDVVPIIFMIGLVGMYRTRPDPIGEKWQYLLLLIIPVITLVSYYLVIKPYFCHGDITDGTQAFSQYFDVITNLSENNTERLSYIAMIFVPLLFIPLFAPELVVIALPVFMENLLSPNYFYHSIYSHHSAPLIPILFIALIVSLDRIFRGFEGNRGKQRTIIYLLILSSILCAVSFSPAFQEAEYMFSDQADLEKHTEVLNSVIAAIPEEAAVSTQPNLATHLSNRKLLWQNFNENADIVLYDTAYPQSSVIQDANISSMMNYQLAAHGNGIFLYAKTGA